MEKTARIRVRTHHFVVDQYQHSFAPVLRDFAGRLTEYEWKKDPEFGYMFKTAKCVYADRTVSNSEQRFHINSLDDFLAYLKDRGVNMNYVEIVRETPDWEPNPCGWSVLPNYNLRPAQEPLFEFYTRPDGPATRLLELQTGGGKSVVFMHAVAALGHLPVLFVKPSYIEKWIINFKDSTDIDPERIYTVEGSAELMELLQRAVHDPGYNPGVILISVVTYQNYLKEYRLHGAGLLEQGYACLPDQLFKHLRAGIHGLDEGHEFFHLNFRIALHTHVQRSLVMTATLIDRDPFKMDMYRLAYPPETRQGGGAYKQYVTGYSVSYTVRDPERLRTTEFRRTSYSHSAYEKSIMRNPKYKEGYFNMQLELLKQYFWTDWVPGNKAAIYCYSRNMCTELTNWLKKKLPDKTIERYIQGDSYKNLMEPEIRVTTQGKAGTAVDIPGLKLVLETVMKDSPKQNLQLLGRLRELKDPPQTPRYVWIYNGDIRKHLEYNKNRLQLFHGKLKSVVRTTFGPPIF